MNLLLSICFKIVNIKKYVVVSLKKIKAIISSKLLNIKYIIPLSLNMFQLWRKKDWENLMKKNCRN